MNKKQKSISLINAIQENIIQRNLLKPNTKIFLCVSGGQDSSCLIFIILFLKNQWNWSIGIIYSNHLWQQKSFFIFLELARIIYKLNLQFIYSISLEKLTNENRSRKWRYTNFYRLCYFYDTNFLLTGHTFSDRLETVLFNMLRGSGINSFYFLDWKKNYFLLQEKNNFIYIKKFQTITRTKFHEQSSCEHFMRELELGSERTTTIKGFQKSNIECVDYKKKKYFFSFCLKKKNDLGSLKKEEIYIKTVLNVYNRKPLNKNFLYKFFYCLRKKNQNIKVIRPLLALNRIDIKHLTSNYNLFVFLDKSNQTEKYSRNRIRNQLLPTLRFFFNPQIDNIYFQYSEIGAFEENYFDYLTNKLITQIEYKTNVITSIDTSLFTNLPKSLQRRIYKFFLEKIIKKTISFAQSELLISSILFSNKNRLQNKKQYKCVLYPKFGVFLVYKNQLCIIK